MTKLSKNKMNWHIQTLFVCIVAVTFSLVSCEGYRCAVGTVYDKYSQMPIENVKYRVSTIEQEHYSDSIGRYSICGKFGSLIPKPNIDVEFSKDGYKTITVRNPDNANIYLENLQILSLLEQNLYYCGQNNNSELNNYEAEFLNNYVENRKDFDFNNKKILFITGSNGGTIASKEEFFNNVKEWHEKDNRIQNSLVLLSNEEYEEYGYSAIILYWVKIFTPKTKSTVLEKSKVQI